MAQVNQHSALGYLLEAQGLLKSDSPLNNLLATQKHLREGLSPEAKLVILEARAQAQIQPDETDAEGTNEFPVNRTATPPIRNLRPSAVVKGPQGAQNANVVTLPKRSGSTKKCAKCGLLKPIEEFGSNSTSSDGRQTYCRPCKNHLNTLKRQNDLDHRLKHHIATRVAKQLEGRLPANYTQNLETYLGYKMWQLRKALENDLAFRGLPRLKETFRLGWHLDHYKPLSSYIVKEIDSQAFIDCWAISNLRMIPAAENLAKSNKILPTPVSPVGPQ